MEPMEPFGLGIARSNEPVAAEEQLRALGAAIAASLSIEVRPTQTKDYRELADAVAAREVAMAWLPPLVAMELSARELAEPIALPVRNDATSYRAALFVTVGGPRSLSALGGSRVAWVDRASAAGYAVPRMMVAAAGHDPATFFATESFYQSHDRAVDAVLADLADVGATYCRTDEAGRVLWAGWAEHDGLYPERVQVVAMSEPIPNDVWVIGAAVPAERRAALVELLTRAGPVQEQACRLLRAERFVRAEPSHFGPLETLARRAG